MFWTDADSSICEVRSRELAARIAVDNACLWAWCIAFAAIVAAGRAMRGGAVADIEALVALAA